MSTPSRSAPASSAEEAGAGCAAWSATLDRLEHDLVLAARLLASASAGTEEDALPEPPRWEPPTGLGPLPAELVQRARTVAGRQAALEHDLRQSVRRARQQREVTDRINGGAARRSVPPAYLNLEA